MMKFSCRKDLPGKTSGQPELPAANSNAGQVLLLDSGEKIS